MIYVTDPVWSGCTAQRMATPSASAVACAAWRVGWVQAGAVSVVMPGGTAPILLQEREGELVRVSLFGAASAMR